MHVKAVPRWDPALTPTFWINHASRALMRRFEEALRPHGFGLAYLRVVMALKEEGSLDQKDLLVRAKIEQPTMAALLSRMERDGLIARKTAPDDARARLLSLTPKAKARLPAVLEAMADVVDQALAGVEARERTLLMTVLKRVVTNLESG